MALAAGTSIVSMVVAGAGVLIFTPLAARTLERNGVLDVPNARSSHDIPTARGAGLVTGSVLALALVLGWDRTTATLAVVAIFATAIGGFEDLCGSTVTTRLIAQVCIGAFYVTAIWGWVGAAIWPGAVGAVGAVIFIVAYTNTFNFMDGINGISAVSAAVAGIGFSAEAAILGSADLWLVGAVLAVSALCFLPFNFPQPHVFLGDSGSYSYGAVIASAAVFGWHSGIRPEAILAPLAIYLADTGTVVVRRLMQKKPLTVAHRQHTYQRLVRLGASHAQTTIVVLALTGTTAVMGVAIVTASMVTRVGLDLGISIVTAFYLLLPTILVRANLPRLRR